MNYAADHWLNPMASLTPLTQIDLVEKEKPIRSEREKMIIKQLDSDPNNLLDSEVPARFESAIKQRVQKETRVAHLGIPNNNSGNSTGSGSNLNEQKSELKREFEEFVVKKQNPFPQSIVSQSTGSAFNQNLPSDIELADATNLNTDANIYYSFYNRIQELFYVRWIEDLNAVWRRTPEEFKIKQLSNHSWSTIIEIWLNSNGEYHSSYLLKGSGYQPFDQAPVKAFKDARFFPNPPQAKVESDGFIRLKYRFTVHVGSYR